jgi:predicted DCC family thiol-disulfide oxidoreductase YuxK
MTAPEHQRRGLGTAVMAALTTAAMGLEAATGILGATEQGRALYEALGWAVAGPLSSFVYKRADTSRLELRLGQNKWQQHRRKVPSGQPRWQTRSHVLPLRKAHPGAARKSARRVAHPETS